MDVKRGPILFRCDGTRELGYEPLYQCLSLAAALQRRRRGTHFLSYLDPLSLAHTINSGNNEWIPAEQPISQPGDLGQTLQHVHRLGAAAVILAGRTWKQEDVNALSQSGAAVLMIDSEGLLHHSGRIVVNPLLGPGIKAFRYDRGTQLLLGRKYALVRGLFRRQRTIRAVEQPGPFRGLIAFGDDDFGDQTLCRAEQLMQLPKVHKISLAVRTHHPRYHELKDFAAESNDKVEVITEPKELMTRLVRSHFALTSGCGWSLELCCVGIPQLVLASTPRHALNAKRLDDEGAGTFLGLASEVSFEQLAEAVGIVLDDQMERQGMNRCGRNLIDGRGGDRIVNGLEILLHTPWIRRAAEVLRPAAAATSVAAA